MVAMALPLSLFAAWTLLHTLGSLPYSVALLFFLSLVFLAAKKAQVTGQESKGVKEGKCKRISCLWLHKCGRGGRRVGRLHIGRGQQRKSKRLCLTCCQNVLPFLSLRHMSFCSPKIHCSKLTCMLSFDTAAVVVTLCQKTTYKLLYCNVSLVNRIRCASRHVIVAYAALCCCTMKSQAYLQFFQLS